VAAFRIELRAALKGITKWIPNEMVNLEFEDLLRYTSTMNEKDHMVIKYAASSNIIEKRSKLLLERARKEYPDVKIEADGFVWLPSMDDAAQDILGDDDTPMDDDEPDDNDPHGDKDPSRGPTSNPVSA
jgi:hypothetical protein